MSETAPPPTRRRRRVALVAAGLFVAILLALWLVRVPLATRFVDRELAAAGVPARYTVAGLGPRGQRLTNVSIGDPAAPDLVADWIETETGIGLSGPYLRGVRAGHVRIRARLVDGKVSLGAIDRLLRAPSGKPFALPALAVTSDDVRIRLETPAGVLGLKLAGRGRLDDGFRGTLAAVAPRLAAGGCVAGDVRAVVRLRIADAAPAIAGPVRAGAVDCGTARMADVRADLSVSLSAALDRWRGQTTLASGGVVVPGAQAAGLDGTVDFAGSTASTAGDVDMTARRFLAGGVAGETARLRGGYSVAWGGIAIPAGTLAVAGVQAPARLLAPLAGSTGTPVAPLADALARVSAAALRSFDAGVRFAARVTDAGGSVVVSRATVDSASGVDATLGDAAVRYRWPDGGLTVGGRLTVRGGGMPALDVRLAQTHPGAAVTGVATLVRPYVAGGASLALTPVRFSGGGGATTIRTTATLSGPVAGGVVEALVVPVDARWRGGGLALNPGCTPVSAARVAVAGLVLDRPAVTLCAERPLVRVAGGRVSGGARLPELRLRGTLGASPLTILAEGGRIDLAGRSFALEGVRTSLGAPERATLLNFAAFGGAIRGGGAGGDFAGGTGRIGTVPLVLGEASGGWSFANGALAVDGGLVVTDAADVARFQPMRGQGVRLTLEDGVIDASAMLIEPTTATKVAEVAIHHVLATGTGTADLRVPALTFREGFQPEMLTRITFGVIADVRGTVTGDGRIAWTPEGVTSTGRFGTASVDLAAAFGPVKGLAGTIAFDDLLSLRSAPDQRVTVKSINPGIEVVDGAIAFRTLSSTQVQVDGGRWPFAGGTLTLEPTTLDFGQDQARRMTFTVAGAAADRFLQQFDFENLNATGIFDGTLPMVFDGEGGRIVGGRLKVRTGGGSLAYVGDLTQKDLGFWGNFAFQSLRALRYRDLSVAMNGPLAGEMVTEVRFAGISQGEGAKSNFLIRRLQRLPLVFNIRIKAPFRGLIDSAQSFYDPRRLIQRNLPALLEAERLRRRIDAPPPVQPPASETVP